MSRSKWIAVAAAVVLLLGAAVVFGGTGDRGGVVDNAQLRELVAEGVRLVDVRTEGEFEAGHIPGAENVPVDRITDAAGAWDPSAPIALYCATGGRSADAASALASLGFETVYDLGGGIAQWDGEVEGGPQRVVALEPVASGLPVMYEFYTDW